MELQWTSTPYHYLRSALRQVQNQEQTLELRLTEGMPDIGRILCSFGQIHLRGKEWRSETVHISGGVKVWVLYAPEDGSSPRSVEGWIPFQAKWALPQNCREGVISADAVLRSLDGRSTSARKILVRASLGLLADAMTPEETAVYTPEQIQQDVCLLSRSYPVQLMQEAGEKQFSLEDTWTVEEPSVSKLLSCCFRPMVTEQAVTGNRLVMRGMLQGQYVAIGEEGRLCGGTIELPFAQFAELEQSYDKEASCAVTMALSDSECSLESGELRIKCGFVAQYTVHNGNLLQLVEDAYSPTRMLTPAMETLELPVLLEQLRETITAQEELQIRPREVVDVSFLPDHPIQYREDDRLVVELPGQYQVLYYDMEDQLQSANQNWSGRWELPAGSGCNFRLGVDAPIQTTVMSGDKLTVSNELLLNVCTCAQQQFPMVTGINMGQAMEQDPDRPSVILRRKGDDSLWAIAKGCGSTVEAIEQANDLTGVPSPEQMLLIPVV